MRATHHFAGNGTSPTDMPFFLPEPVDCPFCGAQTTTRQGRIMTHLAHGFMCVAVNMTLAQAAALEIDAMGRLVGVDEMAVSWP